MTPEDEPPRSEGVQYATGGKERSTANLPAMQETLVWFLGQEDALEKG